MTFLAGQKLSAAALNSAAPTGAAQSVVNTTAGNTTSSTYTPTLSAGGTVTLAFVTPASGKIWVTYTATGVGTTSAEFPSISFAISGAAGTLAASTDRQAFNKSTSAGTPESTISRRTLVTGLTPGAAGTITMNFKSFAGGTVTFNNKQLQWEPVAA